MLPPGFCGTSENLKPVAYDPARAKALLAEAGYPNGFGLTVHGPNDRYINDAKIAQAIGHMLTRIGITTQLEPLPHRAYLRAPSPGGPPRTVLHKPGSVDRAVGQLLTLAGRTHTLTAGGVARDPASGRLETAVDKQRLTMRSYGETEARAYVEAARPLVYATAMLLVILIVALNIAAIRIRNQLRDKYNAGDS